MTNVNMSCAPALPRDGEHVYVAATNANFGCGYLLELAAGTLAPEHQVRLKDPAFPSNDALILDASSATPTVGPDGDVFFGVLENPFPLHHDRGRVLHFSADLEEEKIPGGFGWDDTASIVDASLVPSYDGSSKYLLMTKYNNYADRFGDVVNKIAILDPTASEPDLIYGNPVMNEVLTIKGVTPDPRFPFLPGAARMVHKHRCCSSSNQVSSGQQRGRQFVPLDLTTNTFSEVIAPTGGIGVAYTPTVIGSDGTAYAINDAVLFGIGR